MAHEDDDSASAANGVIREQKPASIESEITRLLSRQFAPVHLDIINDSARHKGHAGDDGSGESHFTVIMVSALFEGKSRLERQRMVHKSLGDIPGDRVHALSIKALTPEEYEKRAD